jgi:hypothetical protein
MAWVGIPYELIVGNDRAVVGNSDTATADPDFCGTLTPDSGITGLLDRAGVRESTSDLVEADGATHGPFWLSRRSGVLQGFLRADSLDPVVVSAAESKLKRATRALRADGILRWTPPNDSSPRQLRFRVQDGPRITGRRPKAWQVTLVSTDPYALSSTEQSVVITPGQARRASSGSRPDDRSDHDDADRDRPAVRRQPGRRADVAAVPDRRADHEPADPEQHDRPELALAYTLNPGEWLDVYPQPSGAILLNGTTSSASALDFPNSSWWQLQPARTTCGCWRRRSRRRRSSPCSGATPTSSPDLGAP